MQELIHTPNVGQFFFGDGVPTHTHTQIEMPDGYVKMFFKMMLQFFIPAEFIQDPVFAGITTRKVLITLKGHRK